MTVLQLGYLGFHVRDVDAWDQIAQQLLGCEARQATDCALNEAGTRYLRLDERHHRLALIPRAEDALAYVGYEVADAAALSRVLSSLRAAGVDVIPATPAEVTDRRVMGMVRFHDPAGLPCELYHGPVLDEQPFRPARAISGFVTGGMGLGHIVLATRNYDATVAFYVDLLGFRISDYMDFQGTDVAFLHCNPRHHTVAVLRAPGPELDGQLLHFMLEVRSLDDVGRAYDLCADLNVPISLSMGRHTNDLTTSFYLKTPSGFEVEYGWGGRTIDDATWQINKFMAASLWGHRPAHEPV